MMRAGFRRWAFYLSCRRGLGLGLIASMWLVCAAPRALAEESLAFSLFGGLHDVNESDQDLEYGAELRKPFHGGLFGQLGLTAVLGATGTDEEAFWLYAGARRDFSVSDRWVVTPGFAVSYYDEGDGKDLGGEVEFRSSIELAYRMTTRTRVGVALYHLSNAGIYDRNPGFNSVILSWSIEAGR